MAATTTSVNRDETTSVNLDELIDPQLIRQWLLWGMAWVMLMPAVGVLISGMFTFPDYLGVSPYVQFGRLRPVHVNGVIFGAFSTLFIGLCYYIVPRLAGVTLTWPRLGYSLVWVWNLTVLAGLASLLLGYNQGFEAGEFPIVIDTLLLIAIAALTAQFLITFARRRFQRLYVATWYLIATFVWTTINLIMGTYMVPFTLHGTNNAAFHGLFIHYIVGLWITPAGYVLIYYFLPVARQKSGLQPQAVARRILVTRSFLSLRRHPPLSLQPDRRLGGDHFHRHVHAADHSGLDGARELLRNDARALGHLRAEPASQVPDHGLGHVLVRLLPGID